MLKLNTITFKDEETGKIVEVQISSRSILSSTGTVTPDEYVTCLFHSQALINNMLKNIVNNS